MASNFTLKPLRNIICNNKLDPKEIIYPNSGNGIGDGKELV
jgi:hypothetical protein